MFLEFIGNNEGLSQRGINCLFGFISVKKIYFLLDSTCRISSGLSFKHGSASTGGTSWNVSLNLD